MKQAKKNSFRRAEETCQEVKNELCDKIPEVLARFMPEDWHREFEDALIEAAMECSLNKGTLVLREALIDCEDELIDANQEIEELKSRILDLEYQLEEIHHP